MGLPTITNYGRYSGGNYGAHTLCVSILGVDVYFSYTTVVAFRAPDCKLVVHQNDWSKTTGKHLNFIDGGKGQRVDDETFQRLWKEHVEKRLEGVHS